MKSTSRDDLEAQLWLALSSMEDTRSFLGHGQIAQSDTLGALMAVDVNLTLASRDRFISCLCPYLAPWHCNTLRYSDFMSESLTPALQEVIVASREDATHKSTRHVANLGLAQGSWPSSQDPPCSGDSISRCPTGSWPPCSRQSFIWSARFLLFPGRIQLFRKWFPPEPPPLPHP